MNRLILSLILIAFSAQTFAADPVWKQRTSYGDLHEVVFADGRFVAVSPSSSSIYISADGKDWEVFDWFEDHSFTDIVYGNGRYVAVGEDYGYSVDGVSWVTGKGPRFYDVTFANGIFVAVGSGGAISTSQDGENWTEQTSDTTNRLFGVTFGDNEFVAVGDSTTMIRSINGIDWLPVIQDVHSDLTSGRLDSIVYLDNRYYLQGSNNVSFVANNITNWSFTSVDVSAAQWNAATGIATDGLTFINFRGQRSADGLIWTQAVLNNTLSISYGNGVFIIVGESGAIYSSEDGIDWQQRGGNELGIDRHGAIIFAEGRFIGARLSPSLRSSFDGLQLDYSTLVLDVNDDFRDIHYDGSLYIAVTDDGAIHSSNDAIAWTERLPKNDVRKFYAVVSGGGRFVAVGDNGTVFTSADGLTWSDATSVVTGTALLYSVTHGSQGFVAVGNAGALFASPDGLVWTDTTSGTSSALNKVVYGHGKYVAVGDNGTHLSSSDTLNWVNTDTGSRNFEDVAVTDTGFVAVGSVSTVSTSTDGVNWDDIRISLRSSILDKVVSAGDVLFVYNDFSSTFSLGDFVSGTGPEHLADLQLQDRRSGFGAFDIAFGNGRFVTAGGGSYGSSSADIAPVSNVTVNGKQWRTIETPYVAGSILFQGGRFIAVSNNVVADTTVFIYSLDGLTWTTGNTYKDIGYIDTLEYLNGLYIAVGNGGLIMTSMDGNDWFVSLPNGSSSLSLDEVFFANGRFMATDYGQTRVLVSDNNGTDWTEQTTLQDNEDTTTTAINLRNVYVSGDHFYGYTGAGRHSSSDGVTWSLPQKLTLLDEDGVLTTDLSTISNTGFKVANGLHLAYTGPGYFTTSGDGLNWVRREGNFGLASGDVFEIFSEFHLAYGNNTYVVMSDNESDRVHSTDNGDSWQRVAPRNGEGITYANGKLLRGMHLSASLQVSNNLGVTWSTIFDATNSDGNSDIIDIAYGNNIYVAICEGFTDSDATLFNSADAVAWFDNGGAGLEPISVTYGNGLFVAVGNAGLVLTSTDGNTWEPRDSGTAEDLQEVSWGHAGFVAVGDNNVIIKSIDAINWTAQSAPYEDDFTAVGYRAGVYVITGHDQILRSTDGVVWTRQLNLSNEVVGFQDIAEGTLGFLASSSRHGTWRSIDGGINWLKVSDIGVSTGHDFTQAAGRVFFSRPTDNSYDGITAINGLPTTVDSDGDGIADSTDNCPDDPNADQANNDGDALGNVCDAFPDDAYDDATPPSTAITITLPDGRRVTGTEFTFTAEGFKPFSLVQAFIQSDPIFVGEEFADKDGKVSFAIVLPLELPLGDHTLIVLGQNYDGSERELTNPIKIELAEKIFDDGFE